MKPPFLAKLSRKTVILRPIIFWWSGPSRRRQIEALLEGKAIFRRSIRSSPLILVLTRPWSSGPGAVSALACRSLFCSVAPAFPENLRSRRERTLILTGVEVRFGREGGHS